MADMVFFSEATQRSGVLNPLIRLMANNARSSAPDFPIRPPRTDRLHPWEILKRNHFTQAQKHVGFLSMDNPRKTGNSYVTSLIHDDLHM